MSGAGETELQLQRRRYNCHTKFSRYTYIFPQAIYSFLFLASLMVSSLMCVIFKAGFFTFSLHQVIENIHCKRVCGHNNIWKARMPRKNVCYGFCGVSNFHACRLQAYLTFTRSCHYSVVLLDIFVLSMMYEPLVNVQLQHFL